MDTEIRGHFKRKHIIVPDPVMKLLYVDYM